MDFSIIELNHFIGYTATFLTIIALLPQVWQVVRTKRARDISLASFLLLFGGATCWLIYGLGLGELPIILTNGIIMTLQATIISYKLKFG